MLIKKNKEQTVTFDIQDILKIMPHRYPFLLIDRVRDVVIGEEGIGIKNVTINEPFFPGHFPVKPIMPGVLIVEAMAQTAVMICAKTYNEEEFNKKLVYFMGIDKVKFRRPVVPGDTLEIHLKKTTKKGDVWKFNAVAEVNGKKVTEAKITAMITDNK